MAKMDWPFYVFVGAFCLNQGLALSNLNGERAPDVAKRSVDDGPQANAHIIEKRDDDDPPPTGLPGPFNRPPLGGGGNAPNSIQHKRSVDDGPQANAHIIEKRDDSDPPPTGFPGPLTRPTRPPLGGGHEESALPHRRSVDDFLGDDGEGGMSISHVIHKREDVKEDASLTGDGAMPISHVIHKREEVEDLVDDDEGGMSISHVIRKREEVEDEGGMSISHVIRKREEVEDEGGMSISHVIRKREVVEDEGGMSISHVIRKREEVEDEGGMSISHVIRKREEPLKLDTDSETTTPPVRRPRNKRKTAKQDASLTGDGAMPISHVIHKREQVEEEPIKLDTDSETTTPPVRRPRNKRKTVKQDASLTGDGPAN
eukprot:XP_011681993.1 PREDICTED: uncharacterized protein LOC105446642 isoform X2 [Strongylocentrotus purpuratus]